MNKAKQNADTRSFFIDKLKDLKQLMDNTNTENMTLAVQIEYMADDCLEQFKADLKAYWGHIRVYKTIQKHDVNTTVNSVFVALDRTFDIDESICFLEKYKDIILSFEFNLVYQKYAFGYIEKSDCCECGYEMTDGIREFEKLDKCLLVYEVALLIEKQLDRRSFAIAKVFKDINTGEVITIHPIEGYIYE